MITLHVQVPASRDRTALATLKSGLKRVAEGYAVTSATPKIAAARGNPELEPLRAWGHSPAGTYRLINSGPVNARCADEYGPHILLFEPLSGAALNAQAAGRVGLLVYGGPPGADKRMRRTQGGVRLDNKMLKSIVDRAGHEDEVMLTIQTLRQPAWWQFWQRMPETPLLSSSPAKALAAPFDEMSLVLELMKSAVRRPLRQTSDDRDDSRFNDRSTATRSNSEQDNFRGGGGQSGGAGANGTWDSAATARGTDSSGRIIAGAGLGVAAAIAAGAAAGAVAGDAGNTLAASASDNSGTDSFGDAGNATTETTTSY